MLLQSIHYIPLCAINPVLNIDVVYIIKKITCKKYKKSRLITNNRDKIL